MRKLKKTESIKREFMNEDIEMETDIKPLPGNSNIKVKLPLMTILLVPFILQIILISGLVGYISYINGQKAVNNVVRQLHMEINSRINEYLQDFIRTPGQIIRSNETAISHGILNYQNQFMLEHYFRQQIGIYKSVSSIYFGNTMGGIANSGREAITGTAYIFGTDQFRKGPLRKYSTTLDGNRAKLLLTVPDFDSRTRPWYIGALSKGDAIWSDVYILFTGQDMTISASKPVYDRSNSLLGVVSVDLFLSHISSFLAGINTGKTGISFVIDQSGLMIAASTNEMIFTNKKPGELQRRLSAGESNTPFIRNAAYKIIEKFGSFRVINSVQHLEFNLDGKNNFMQVSPFINDSGLKWLIVTVIPEYDFMDKISSNNRITVILVLSAIIISIILGYATSRWIAQPVLRLKRSVSSLSTGVWPENPGDSRIAEIDDLKLSFFHMSGQLKELIDDLQIEITERRLTEGALRESEEKYRDLIQHSNSIILRMDNTGRVTYANDYALNFFGYSREELLWKNIIETIVPLTDRFGRNQEVMIDEIIKNPGLFERNENENIRKDGSHAWIVWSNREIKDESGRCAEILSIGTDITERRLAEVEIKKLLGEKELLLHEVHHRIKNNMNTIAGLLYLQSVSMDNEAASSALKDAHSRVLSMMLIYDKLFRTSSFSSITTGSYLPDLIAGIISSFPYFGHIKIETKIDDCVLDTNTLVPVGIIINELLTNAYKYAFPSNRDDLKNETAEGLIQISFLDKGNRSFEIIFQDNGVGVPESIVLGESKGFGLNLVSLLTEQMRGSVQIERNQGTTFRIMFSI